MISEKIKELEREIEELRDLSVFDNVEDYQELKELSIKLQLLKELSLEIEKVIDELLKHTHMEENVSCVYTEQVEGLKQELLGGKDEI